MLCRVWHIAEGEFVSLLVLERNFDLSVDF